MGEQRAAQECIVSNQADDIYWRIDYLPITDNVVRLHSFCSDNLIYIYNPALEYNNCKFNSALEAALMFKSKGINGEKSHAC